MRKKREFYGPLPLVAILQHRAVQKISDEKLNEMIHGYFVLYNESKQNSKFEPFNEFLILTCTFAEVYSKDPIYILFTWGIVLFKECIGIHVEKLRNIFEFTEKKMLKSLRKSEFFPLPKFPQEGYQLLQRLGFFDSNDWLLYIIPDDSELKFHLFHHQSIVQPFPIELIHLLKENLTPLRLTIPQRVTSSKKKKPLTEESSESDKEMYVYY